MRRFPSPVVACLPSRRRLVCNRAFRLVEGHVVARGGTNYRLWPSQYGGVRAPLQCSVAFAPRRAATPRPIIAVRCCVRSVACGVACSPWAEPYASTNWLGRHQAGPSFVFCRPSLMFAGAYLLGFGRAISLKEPPCGLKGPFADSDSLRAKGRAWRCPCGWPDLLFRSRVGFLLRS